MAEYSDRDRLVSALIRADTPALVAVLMGDAWPRDALQVLGEAVLVVATTQQKEIVPAARRCTAELRDRGWAGDAELADQLDGAFGWGPASTLRPLAVGLDELAEVLEGDMTQGGGRIELGTGEVWPEVVFENSDDMDDDEDEDDDRWLYVSCEGSRQAYRDMQIFIGDIAGDPLADRLDTAIQGRGAFRRFHDALERSDERLTQWHGFSDERLRGRAREWLAGEGYAAVPKGIDSVG